MPYSSRKRETEREKEQERGECFVALERPKIAPYTLTHTGVIVQQWESKREGENTQHGWMERRGKVQKG